MPTDEETLHDGPIYKFVRKRYHWREPEFWEALKAEVVRQSDAAGLLADIEDDLRGFLSRQSTLREETREDRERAAFGPAKAGPDGVTERRICEMGLIATFSEQPTFRAEAAIDVLQSLPGVRRFLEQHPDAGYGFVAGFAMGLTMEMLRVMEHEPDTGLGQQQRLHLREMGKKRGAKYQSRDAAIRAQHSQMRAEETTRRDAEIYRELGRKHGLSPERIRQIVRE
ncbi:MAG: hypothetical protein IT431_13800 [Phycisphaerales bacterium]|nr:hypothetical protein [Phycisphaerales bacterium]